MYKPKFTETPSLSYHLSDIERVRFRIERMLIMPKHEQWLRREAFVRTAYSSTMVENNTIPEQEMEDAARLSPMAAIPKERIEVANYGRSLEFVDFISDSEIAADESAIRQIHWLLMKGINDTKLKPGQYRIEPNWIEDQGMKVYEPPFHVDIPILMRELSVWLREDTGTNPVLKAGVAHAYLVAIHPFADGNGRAARLLATLLLQKSGYGFRKLLSLDVYYQRNRDKYIQALSQSLGQKFSQDIDLTAWLEFFTFSISIQGALLEDRLTDWRIMVEKYHKDLAPLGLNDRQVDGLIYAARIGYIGRKDYCEITHVSPLTATRDLSQMVQKGILSPEGGGRSRRYKYTWPEKASEKKGAQPSLL